jgi:hypothetical protein
MEPRKPRVVVAFLDAGFALFARETKGDEFYYAMIDSANVAPAKEPGFIAEWILAAG